MFAKLDRFVFHRNTKHVCMGNQLKNKLMFMKQYFVFIQLSLLTLLLAGVVVSCKKMDDYKKFAAGGEIIYPAPFDSLKVIPGNGRVMITGLLTGDPNVTKYKVFWNNGSDSLEQSITRHGKI